MQCTNRLFHKMPFLTAHLSDVYYSYHASHQLCLSYLAEFILKEFILKEWRKLKDARGEDYSLYS